MCVCVRERERERPVCMCVYVCMCVTRMGGGEFVRAGRGRGASPANMAHSRQSKPDPGLGFQAKVLETFPGVPSSLGSGQTK